VDRCSACGRRLRIKRVPGTLGGNYANPGKASYTDWLGHAKTPLCPRYGRAPDTTERQRMSDYPKRYDVTDDRGEWLVRFGGEPFTLERIAQLMAELEHGDEIALTITRQHDNHA
jgi:hypothetical protein